jgi:uncharacterized protein (TIGR02996 family)
VTRVTEHELFAAVAGDPTDVAARSVYADWLEQAGDPRCHFVRQHLRVAPLAADHPERYAGEQELSRCRAGVDPAWLAVIEPERRHHYVGEAARGCDCLVPIKARTRPRESDELHDTEGADDRNDEDRNDEDRNDEATGEDEGDDEDTDAEAEQPSWPERDLHGEPQDTECEAWKRLLDYIDRAAVNGTLRFQPRPEMTGEQWRQIVTLPPTIAKLTSITSIDLYGSHLVRLPREIGAMTSLRMFTPYTSYRLHWFPYEITRCRELRSSTVSTRALYGNYKFRPPFPLLVPPTPPAHGPVRPCSVCDRAYEDLQLHRVWISLRVAGDVLPLLVNACSAACIEQLPAPPEGYIQGPHRGGVAVQQPSPGYGRM